MFFATAALDVRCRMHAKDGVFQRRQVVMVPLVDVLVQEVKKAEQQLMPGRNITPTKGLKTTSYCGTSYFPASCCCLQEAR